MIHNIVSIYMSRYGDLCHYEYLHAVEMVICVIVNIYMSRDGDLCQCEYLLTFFTVFVI